MSRQTAGKTKTETNKNFNKNKKRRTKMTKVTSMNTYLEDLISKTPVQRLVLELENINTHKLNDEVILGCDELRQFYIQKQQLIINHLSQMLMKDAEYED